eukprot:2145991-Karenia_brevis.AAC.1
MHFLPLTLCEQWMVLVNKEKGDFSWDCREYKRSGNANPDIANLLRFAVPLTALLTLTPSGFPAYQDLFDCLLLLQEKKK